MKRRVWLVVGAALVVAVTACGSDDDSSDAASDSSVAASDASVAASDASVAASVAASGSSVAASDSSVASVATGVSVPVDAMPLAEVVSVQIATANTATAAPLYVAIAKGYFEDENLDVSNVVSASGSDVQSLVATGRLDGAMLGMSAGFFNGVANGLDVKIVGQYGQIPESGDPQNAMLVRSDSPYQEVAELRGKKIAVAGGVPGLVSYYLAYLLDQGGLTLGDVELVNLAATDGLVALQNGTVDAAIAGTPAISKPLADGTLRYMGDIVPLLKEGSGNAIIMGPTLLKDNRPAAVAFMRALFRAVREDLQGDWLRDPELAQIMADATGQPLEALQNTPSPSFSDDLAISPTLLENLQAHWRAQNVLTSPTDLPVSSILDPDIIAMALVST